MAVNRRILMGAVMLLVCLAGLRVQTSLLSSDTQGLLANREWSTGSWLRKPYEKRVPVTSSFNEPALESGSKVTNAPTQSRDKDESSQKAGSDDAISKMVEIEPTPEPTSTKVTVLKSRSEQKGSESDDSSISLQNGEKALVIAYCTYNQSERTYDPLGQSEFLAHFFGPYVFPGRPVVYRPCVALPKFLPKDMVPSSQEGLKLLGISSDVHIRLCSFGASDIRNIMTSVPGVQLVSKSTSSLKEHLMEHNLWWTDSETNRSNASGGNEVQNIRWSHGARIHWPSGSIKVPVNMTTGKPFGPFAPRQNKEPWYESVAGVPLQFDTKKHALPADSIAIYYPMVVDTMSWRLTAEKYPNHWSKRVGKPKRPASTIEEALTRPKDFDATAARKGKDFFMAFVNSHCGGPNAYLRSAVIRELFTFTVAEFTNQSVNALGICPRYGKERLGRKDVRAQELRGLSGVETMSRHKFSLAFENSNTPGYVTEKICNAYLAESIPVYFGPPRRDIEKILNMKAFIHCDLPEKKTNAAYLESLAKDACKSLETKSEECFKLFSARLEMELKPDFLKCARKVHELDRNHELYEAMLREPLIPLDDDGRPVGVWDGRELGKMIRVAMTAFEYIEDELR